MVLLNLTKMLEFFKSVIFKESFETSFNRQYNISINYLSFFWVRLSSFFTIFFTSWQMATQMRIFAGFIRLKLDVLYDKIYYLIIFMNNYE